MSKIIFNELQIKQLELNPNIAHVTERSISYRPEFKVKAVKENLDGKGPTQIFVDHGFDLAVIGSKKLRQCMRRWREVFEKCGEEGLLTERRGVGSLGRPSTRDLSVEEQLKRAEARIKFLEAENDFLKKLDELERQAMKKR